MTDQAIVDCELFTNSKVAALREELRKSLVSKDCAVVISGSYARKEASEQSDLDYFVICNSEQICEQVKSQLPNIRNKLRAVVSKDPAVGGAFGEIESIERMGRNIGGPYDDNGKITRRILFLLEGDWLYNEAQFRLYRDEILSKYIDNTISDHQFCRFLLNDLIRYYRTICVDYEHKTKEEGKSWASRNIKLIFSRKLLYFSGILVAAETWQHTYETKLSKLRQLLSLTPIRRIRSICGDRAEPALSAYGNFLTKMGNPAVRKMLETVPEERDKQPEEYRLFKNEGHHFSWMLVKLLRETYDSSHPIHNALIV